MGRHTHGLVVCTLTSLALADPAMADPVVQDRAAPTASAGTGSATSAGRAGGSLTVTMPEAGASLGWPGFGGDAVMPPRVGPSAAGLNLRLPAPSDPARATAKATAEEVTARYLPPVLAEPDRPSGARSWESDLPEMRRYWSPGPFAHPAGKSDLAASCPAPPDPAWLTMLKAQWALDGYGNAEPLPGQASYWPFPCY